MWLFENHITLIGAKNFTKVIFGSILEGDVFSQKSNKNKFIKFSSGLTIKEKIAQVL